MRRSRPAAARTAARSRSVSAAAHKALLEALEDRRMFSVVYAFTQSAGSGFSGSVTTNLITFDTADPTTIRSTTPVTFLGPVDPTGQTPQSPIGSGNQRVVGADIRPSDDALFVVTRDTNGDSLVFKVDKATGNATVATQPSGNPSLTPTVIPINPPLSGTAFGVDFDPQNDLLRVLSNTEQDLVVNADTGQSITTGVNTGSPAYAPGDRNAGANPNVSGLAFGGNFPGALASPAFVIDTNLGILDQLTFGTDILGNQTATLSTVGSLTQDISSAVSFDILTGQSEMGFAADGQDNAFYSVDTVTGKATPVGVINSQDPVVGMALEQVQPGFSFDPPVLSVGENAGTVTVTVTRSGIGQDTATVQYSVTPGTATANQDFFPVPSGTLVFNPGEFSKTFNVQILEDNVHEPTETVLLHLSNPTSTGGQTVIDNPDGQIDIVDDDAATFLQFSQADYVVSEGAGVAHVTVRRTGALGGSYAVDVTTADGTAKAGQDYTPASTTLTFGPNETTKTFDVPIVNDNVAEGTETLDLILSNPTNNAELTQSGAAATITIVDDDSPPAITVTGPASVLEGGAGQTTPVTFTVTLTGGTTQPVTVSFSTSDGTARAADGDYTPTTGTLTFLPGATPIQTITVPVIGDNRAEPDETFSLNLFGVANASLATPQSVVTIANDDIGTSLSADPGNPKKTLLTVTGSPGDDQISVVRAGKKAIEVFVNGSSLGVFKNPGRVAVFAGAGNDDVRVDPKLKIATELHGQDGNDTLQGGAGRDILIGGIGADQLFGGGGDDILIGSTISFDDNPLAMGSVAREWGRGGSYNKRVKHLVQGGGSNGSNVLSSHTIADDGVADVLSGSSGHDFFPFAAGDTITDGQRNEAGVTT